MKTLRVDKYRTQKAALAEAVGVLATGGVVAFPTETSYGLAIDPTNMTALRRLFVLKGRSRTKSLPLVAADIAQVKRIASLKGAAAKLGAYFWPGPLTIITSARKGPYARLAKDGTVAIRVPGATWARALAAAYGRPITATSANFTGETPCFSGTEVRRMFGNGNGGRNGSPDLLLDAGVLPERAASTIIKVKGSSIEIRREGPVTLADIQDVIGPRK